MLQSCIDPLDPADHLDRVINIVTGRIGPEKVNVPNTVVMGRTQMHSYEESGSYCSMQCKSNLLEGDRNAIISRHQAQ